MIYKIFIVPIITILAGYLMYKHPPKKINPIVGYRTRKSMKNKKNWNKANKYCGIVWIKAGIINLIISTVLCILQLLKIIVFTETLIAWIVLIQIIPLLIAIFIVEKQLL